MRADLYHQKGHLKFSSSLLLLCKNISLFIIRYAEVVPVAEQPDPWICPSGVVWVCIGLGSAGYAILLDVSERRAASPWRARRREAGPPEPLVGDATGRTIRRCRSCTTKRPRRAVQSLAATATSSCWMAMAPPCYYFFFHRLLLLTVQFSSWTTGTTENRKFTCLVLKLHHLSYTSFVYKRMQFSYFKESNRLNSN
jgi:hypothetical protein